jgi:exosome complex component RRP42
MSVTKEKPVTSNILQKEMNDLLEQNKRLDGRSLNEHRKIAVDVGIFEKAEGSAIVSLGDTIVLVGIKVETGDPFPDTPNQGVLTVNAELLPLASPTFEPGPPDETSIALARYVDRSVRESKALDLESLVLIPGKLVYVVYIDVYVLDYGGNLTDASVLAAVKALENTRMYKYEVIGDTPRKTDEKVPLPLKNYPVSVTYGLIGTKYFVDPNLEEEHASEGFLSFTFTKEGNVCAVMKNEKGYVSPSQVLEMMERAWQTAVEIGTTMGWESK